MADEQPAGTGPVDLVLGLTPERAVLERLQKRHLVLNWQMADALFADAAELVQKLEHEAAFYRRRVQALEHWQSRMRDPERTVVCDILANGFTLDPPVPRDRYELKA
jgi:hypothetical protein